MAASSLQDPLFEVVLCQLPEVLEAGLRAAGMADPAILESYPCDSYKELVDAGVTDDGTRRYSGAGFTDTFTAGMDAGGLSLSFPLSVSLSIFRPSSLFLPLCSSPSSCINHTQNENCIYPLVD